MMSNYQEIINNWKLAIESQGFTQEQVEKQLDTISRKYQTLKDQLSGMIMSAGNGGLTETIKTVLDNLNMLLRVLNSLSGSFYSGAISIGKFALVLYATNKAMGAAKALTKELGDRLKVEIAGNATSAASSMTAFGTATRGVGLALKTAFKSNAIGIGIFALGEAISYLVEQYDKVHNAAEIALESDSKEYAAQAELLDVTNKRAEFADTLAHTYVLLKQKVDDSSLSQEKHKKAEDDLAFTEKNLASVIGQSAVDRIKSSQNIEGQINSEMTTYHNSVKKKKTALENWLISRQSEASWEYDQIQQQINDYKAEVNAYIDGAKLKVETDSWYLIAKAHFYDELAKMEDKNVSIYEKKRQEAVDRYNEAIQNGGSATEIKGWADNAKYYARLVQEGKSKSSGYKYNAQNAALGEMLDKLEGLKEKHAQVILSGGVPKLPFDPSRSSPLGGDEAYPEEPKKSKGSKSGNGTRRGQAYKDDVLLGLEGRYGNAKSLYEQRISTLKKDAERYGATAEITMAIDNLYEEMDKTLSGIAKEITDHLVDNNNNFFDHKLIADAGDELRQQVFDSVSSYLGTPYVYGGTTRNGIDCSGLVQQVYRSVGIELSRTADYQADDFVNAGAFHYGTDGIQVGDAVFFRGSDPGDNGIGHVGIYAGNGQFIEAQKTGTDVMYSSLDGRNAIGYGSLSQLAVSKGLQVPYDTTLKDLGVNEYDWKNSDVAGKQNIISNLKNREDIKDDTSIMDYLDKLNEQVLANAKELAQIEKDRQTILENKDNDLYNNSKAEVEQRKLEVSQRNTSKALALGLTARDIDEKRMALDEAKAEFSALTDILPRFTEGTKRQKEVLQETQKAQLAVAKAQKAVIESMYDVRNAMNNHEFAMMDFREDKGGIQKATAELKKDMKNLAALRLKKQELAGSLNDSEVYKLDEEIKELADKVRDSMNKYHDAVRDGLESIAEQFVFDGKSISDIFSEMWTNLGRDAMKLLFGQKLDSPSILSQILGLGMPDTEKAVEEAAIEMTKENSDALSMNTDGLMNLNQTIDRFISILDGSYVPPFSQPTTQWGQETVANSLDAFARLNNPSLSDTEKYSFDRFKPTDAVNGAVGGQAKNGFNFAMASITANEKTTSALGKLSSTLNLSNVSTEENTQAQSKGTDATKMNANNTMQLAMGIAGIGNAFANGDWLSGILGIAQVGMSFGLFKANGGAFATGGSMSNGVQAAGRIQGAGTGRSDSILAYLANKGKFVMLSNGEYVINEKSAKALGYDTLDNLNAYADGGALSSPVNPTPYVPTINQQVAKRAINIHSNNTTTEKLLREQNAHMLEQNNLLKNMGQSGGDGKMIILNTQASSADVLKALQENPRAVQAILGRQNRMGFR